MTTAFSFNFSGDDIERGTNKGPSTSPVKPNIDINSPPTEEDGRRLPEGVKTVKHDLNEMVSQERIGAFSLCSAMP